MISFIQSLPVGNAVQILVSPPPGSLKHRLLRRTADAFTGFNDPGAYLVDESGNHNVLDSTGLINGTPYFYKVYSLLGGVWVASDTHTVTPVSAYDDASTDVQTIVRERIELGLRHEVVIGNLKPKTGNIQVLTAPPLFSNAEWPVVIIHLDLDEPGERFIGEDIYPDMPYGNQIEETVGWLSNVRLTIEGWSLNPDERKSLRRALKKIVIGNLPIFDVSGMVLVNFEQTDTEDFESGSAPIYNTIGTFTCQAPTAITNRILAIQSTDLTLNGETSNA